jgi:hypothetical protein
LETGPDPPAIPGNGFRRGASGPGFFRIACPCGIEEPDIFTEVPAGPVFCGNFIQE